VGDENQEWKGTLKLSVACGSLLFSAELKTHSELECRKLIVVEQKTYSCRTGRKEE
jgi:hypothetical protein